MCNKAMENHDLSASISALSCRIWVPVRCEASPYWTTVDSILCSDPDPIVLYFTTDKLALGILGEAPNRSSVHSNTPVAVMNLKNDFISHPCDVTRMFRHLPSGLSASDEMYGTISRLYHPTDRSTMASMGSREGSLGFVGPLVPCNFPMNCEKTPHNGESQDHCQGVTNA